MDCEANYCCVNCKLEHPSYSKNCEKWKIEKEIQTIRTKQNISYPEARKIVESRTPTVGTSYAAITVLNANKKTYRTIETQTESPIEDYPQPKITKENQKKPIIQSQTPKTSQSNSSKLPLHKRSKDNTTHLQPTKQNCRSTAGKYLPSVKSTTSSTNPPPKKKKPTSEKTKKINLPQEETLLSLHPTESSGNEDDDNMSVNSNEGQPDIYI